MGASVGLVGAWPLLVLGRCTWWPSEPRIRVIVWAVAETTGTAPGT